MAGRGFLWGPLAERASKHPTAAVDGRGTCDGCETVAPRETGAGGIRDEHLPTTVPSHVRRNTFHTQEGGDSNRERAGAIMAEGGSLVSSLGGQGGVAGVEVMVPSLAGSSELSSGVISGFRRALVWADGGQAAATAAVCPSILSRYVCTCGTARL